MKFTVWLNGKELPVQKARVSAFPLNRVWPGKQRDMDQTEWTEFVSFDLDCEGKGELEIRSDEGKMESVEIRPLPQGIPMERTERGIRLRLGEPCQFTVEAGDRHSVLHVFANPPFRYEHVPGELYFGPGEHHAGVIEPEDGQTVCIDEGAVVYGAILLLRKKNVRIVGRGILDSSELCRGNDWSKGEPELSIRIRERGLTPRDAAYSSGFVAFGCTNLFVEGIVLRDAPFWAVIVRNNCRDVVIDNIKLIGMWRYNSDGIDICASQNVTVRNSFIRSFDDCLVARGAHLDGEDTPLQDILFENCVLWCDWGKAMEVWNGKHPFPIERVVFRKCRIVHLSAIAMDVTTWFGSADTRIRDILFEEIEVDRDKTYYALQIQNSEEDRYLWKTDAHPKLIAVNCERLGPDLGNQAVGRMENPDDYHLRYDAITFRNIRQIGEGENLGTHLASLPGFLEIHHLSLEQVETDRILLEGHINNLNIKEL